MHALSLLLLLLVVPLHDVLATRTIRRGRSLTSGPNACEAPGLSELSCAYEGSTQVEGQPLKDVGEFSTVYWYIYHLAGLYDGCVWDWVAGPGNTEAEWKQPIVDFYTQLFPPHTKLNSKVPEMVEQAWQMQGKKGCVNSGPCAGDCGCRFVCSFQLQFTSLF